MPRRTAADIQQTPSKFMRHGKKPRQKCKTLQKSSDRGGLAVPNITFYNRACHARLIWQWFCDDSNLRISVDSWACSPFSLWSLIMCDNKYINPVITENPILYNSIKVWHQITRYLKRNGALFLLTPKCRNPEFFPGEIGRASCRGRVLRLV